MTAATRYESLARAITEAYPTLPNRLQGIARFALDNPDQMALSTVAEIADAAGVPPSAVIRFANALGFEGFLALQRVYRERLVARSATYRERIESLRKRGGGSNGVLPQLADSAIGELEQLREHVDPSLFRRAAALVLEASRVHVLAQRRAFPVAAYLAYGLSQLEVPRVPARQRRRHAAPAGVAAARRRPADRRVVPQLLARSRRGRVDLPPQRRAGDRAHRPRGQPAREGGDAALRSRRQPRRCRSDRWSAPLCAAQALVMSVGYAQAERPRAPQGSPQAGLTSRERGMIIPYRPAAE